MTVRSHREVVGRGDQRVPAPTARQSPPQPDGPTVAHDGDWRLRLSFWLRPRFADPHAVALRQVCIAGVYALSLLVLLVPGMRVITPAFLLLSIAMVVLSTAFAFLLPLHGRSRWPMLSIPFLDYSPSVCCVRRRAAGCRCSGPCSSWPRCRWASSGAGCRSC
ncbi:MAG: hypothetical protein ACR2P2_08795 [Nakamurella sp.]